MRHKKKKRGNQLLLIPLVEALALPIVKDKQCINPRFSILHKYTLKEDDDHCVIA